MKSALRTQPKKTKKLNRRRKYNLLKTMLTCHHNQMKITQKMYLHLEESPEAKDLN
jgi:hypothetical protein